MPCDFLGGLGLLCVLQECNLKQNHPVASPALLFPPDPAVRKAGRCLWAPHAPAFA